jgi:hypothetical protein
LRRSLATAIIGSALSLAPSPALAQPQATWATPRKIAVERTTAAKATLVAAADTNDKARQEALLVRAASEYALAEEAWLAVVKTDFRGVDERDGLYWLADARHQRVRIQVLVHRLDPKKPMPTRRELDEALAATTAVLASRGVDYVTNAAFFLVDLVDVDRDLAFLRYDETKGVAGVPKRTEVRFDGTDPTTRKVGKDSVPVVVMNSILARDLYVKRVPPETDPRTVDYRYYSADQLFLYGQFAAARPRFESLWRERCARDEFGYRAWEKLITMSNLEGDVERTRELAEAERSRSCALGRPTPHPDPHGSQFIDARRKFEAAQKAPPDPTRARLWLDAAMLYEQALLAAPGRDEAPEAAFNAAYAYKQIGNYERATKLYSILVADYGSEERMARLEKGDAAKKIAPSPRQYAEHLRYTLEALEALATAQVAVFDYPRAAETFGRIAANARFAAASRRQAAKNALILFKNLERKGDLLAAQATLVHLGMPAEEKTEVDYLVASYAFDRAATDSAAAREARRALAEFFETHRASAAGTRQAVEAAYRVASLSKGDASYRSWLERVVTSWQAFRVKARSVDGKSEAERAPWIDYAAEAQLALVDEDIRTKLESTPPASRAVEVAEKLDAVLLDLAKRYGASEHAASAIARAGAVYDMLYTTAARHQVERTMIERYTTAIAMATRLGVVTASVAHARLRLALLAPPSGPSFAVPGLGAPASSGDATLTPAPP